MIRKVKLTSKKVGLNLAVEADRKRTRSRKSQMYTEGVGQDLLAEIERARSGGKVYKTYVELNGRQYTIMTTTEEIYLDLGLLSEEGLQLLCVLLDGRYEESDFGLLLSIEKMDREDSRSVLIVRSSGSNLRQKVFLLAPA
jgi:hypothetical protein